MKSSKQRETETETEAERERECRLIITIIIIISKQRKTTYSEQRDDGNLSGKLHLVYGNDATEREEEGERWKGEAEEEQERGKRHG